MKSGLILEPDFGLSISFNKRPTKVGVRASEHGTEHDGHCRQFCERYEAHKSKVKSKLEKKK